MKKVVLNLVFVAGCALSSIAQTKSSIAVANPNVNNLFATPEIAAKLIRYELNKMEEYGVYDEFDMKDAIGSESSFNDCLSKTCLTELGSKLGVDFIVSGSFDGFENKIVITLKFIDVKNNSIYKSGTKEFDNQEAELQRMTEILIKELHGIPVPKELNDRLSFKNELITSNNVGKVNNSGPRVGYAYMVGGLNEFARRSEIQGGMDIFPGVSMIGYQIEGQYVGTENFSALVEGLVNFTGLEQGQFMPSISIMNGFRFGKAGWEVAFGPAFGLKKVSNGFFDTEGLIGEKGDYISQNQWSTGEYFDQDDYPEYYSNGFYEAPDPTDFNANYNFKSTHADMRGRTKINTMFVFAVGRTFRAGALNIPVNVFYSSRKGGGMAGMSVGFNVMKSKKPINK